MKHSYAHAIIEIADVAEKAHGAIDKGSRVIQAISLPNAFRKYQWLHLAPELNQAGNFRGMVINARWKSIYQISTKVHEFGEKPGIKNTAKALGVVATFGNAIGSAEKEFEDIWTSNDDYWTKIAKSCTQVTSVALRVVTGTLVVPETKTLLSALALTSGAFGKLTGGSAAATNLREFAEDYSKDIDVKLAQFSDGKEMYHIIETKVNPWVWNNITSRL